MLRYAADYGVAATEGTEYAPKWDSLIETSLALLSDSQCADTGLVVSDCISNMRGGGSGRPCMLATGVCRDASPCWGVADLGSC